MDEAEISRDAVKNSVTPDIQTSSAKTKTGQFNGRTNIDGKQIDYSAFKFKDESINVSRITTPKE